MFLNRGDLATANIVSGRTAGSFAVDRINPCGRHSLGDMRAPGSHRRPADQAGHGQGDLCQCRLRVQSAHGAGPGRTCFSDTNQRDGSGSDRYRPAGQRLSHRGPRQQNKGRRKARDLTWHG